MDTFRVLHISDLHMAVRPRMVGFPDWEYLPQFPGGVRGYLAPSSYDPDLTEAAARWVWRFPNRFDVLLISGDMATTGHPHDLDLARDYLYAPAQATGVLAAAPASLAGER